MNPFYKSFCNTAVALSFFTALTSAAHAQAVIIEDQVANDAGADVVMVPERTQPMSPRGSIVEDKIGLTIQMGVSRGKVKAHEFVYDGAGDYGGERGRKISELIWESNNVIMLGGKGSIAFGSRVNLYGEVWGVVHDKSQMDDYDWVYGDRPTEWTHWSHHEKTELDSGYIMDFALGFSALKTKAVTFDLLAGFRRDSWTWKAYGGDFVYSDTYNDGFRDQRFNMGQEVLGITYQQQFSTPYLGVAAQVDLGRLNLSGKAIGSHWVNAHSKDDHHLRTLRIKDDFHNTKMYSLEGEASFAFTERYSAGVGYSYTKYERGKGEAKYTDYGNHTYFYAGDTAGADQEYSKLNIFVKSKF